MAKPFLFEQSVAFAPQNASEILRSVPALPGVFALRGAREEDQPYLTRAADLRRRITRILAPPEASTDGQPAQSKRLNLSSRVARIEYTVTGSEFESTLTLYRASASIFGLEEARRRLKLRTPFFLRFTAENAYPRVYSTNRLSRRALDNFYGPFPSRAAADRYCDAVLDLFKLRRCYEDLAPHPEHPGCVYQEMKKCLAPCNQACTPEGAAAYSAEATAVKRFFDTRGESMVVSIGLEREEASAGLNFERAAELHGQWHKVKAAQALADVMVQPISLLSAVIVQRATESGVQDSGSREQEAPDSAAVFLLHGGCIVGPARLSTLGVRAVKEQTSVGSSLFAQPLMLQAIPLDDAEPETPTYEDNVVLSEARSAQPKDPGELSSTTTGPVPSTPEPTVSAPTLNPEARATTLIAALEEEANASSAGSAQPDLGTLSDHLSLLRRWYYRPEKQRAGEVFLPNANHQWPIRRILNGAARAVLGDPRPMAETQRELVQRNPEDEAQRPARTKVLHAGRPDVERTVTAAPKKFRSRKSVTPDKVSEGSS